ncbi:hypothetical protein L1987_53410 [Smallanthus sonchifolius]|uniref:Uncharacterized protein n=1 Tax=Smallanthus sonchifolius TaxID=185202 RepID=A0ACB9EWG7_9ASTR|nr:hypothetical protein L1987_53410 [Smallanthus sonchifolius]
METKMEQYQEINRRLDRHEESIKSIHISIWELMEGVKFLVSKTNKEESLSSDDDLKSDDQPVRIVALASALANSSRNQQLDQTDLLQSPHSLNTKVPEPVLTNVEAIKRFMRSSRKNSITVC